MKKTHSLSLFLLFLSIGFSSAQTAFTFETTSVPTQWVAQNGVLAINVEHYKEGTKSLSWTTTGQSMLTITPTSFLTGINCIDFQLHAPVITYDTLKFDFYSGSSTVRSFQLCMNYKGWRDVCRAYSEFATTSLTTISSITVTLLPQNKTLSRTYYFDNVNFLSTTPASRVCGTHWINDATFFTGAASMYNLKSYSYPIDIPTANPTASELIALSSLKKISAYIPTPTVGSAAELAAAIKFTDSLTIVRNSDGSVHGLPLDLKAATLLKTTIISNNNMNYLTTLVRYLEVLAADGTASTTRFNDLLDHLMDQGLAEGLEYFQAPWDYQGSRAIPDPLFNILPSCSASQKEEVLKLCKWMLLYRDMYLPSNQYLYSLNSDRIHLFSDYFMMIALNQSSPTLSVRELKAYKRWLDRNGQYVSGGNDFLKSDGTGFHHATPYIGYMIAYKQFAQNMYNLRGTPFKVDTATYNHLKKAVISEFLMSHLGPKNTEGYTGMSLCGRNPGGRKLTFTQSYFNNLISVGTDLFGTQDNELAAAYNWAYQSTSYIVPTPANYNGFYAFNYGSFGIYRQANWVASMRSPTSTVKGSEIFPTENRFGRYKSHGSLEILYNGYDLSGYPKDSTSWGGWDWNVMPGTTTVHYTNWTDLKPVSIATDRFDQLTKTKNFSGGLSWGDMGLFACDFDQLDSWGGNQKFTPTNLVFKKTVLAVDGLLIDIGTNISSSSSTLNTNTNLFQNIISTNSQALQVNGISTTSSSSLIANTAHTLIAPTGTGYIIPKGNDAISVMYGSQTTPVHTGQKTKLTNLDSTGTVIAAKAFIVHGLKPSNKTYQFVVVPGNTASALATTAASVNSGATYKLLTADSTNHTIYYKPRQIMAYTFFKAVANVKDTFNVVKGIDTEALLLERKSTSSTTAYDFAMANPNLRPVSDVNFGWVATPTTSTLTLKGKWLIKTAVTGVTLVSASTIETKVQVILTEGQPKYFTLDVDNSKTDLEDRSILGKPYIVSEQKNNVLKINLGNESASQVIITFIYMNGTSSDSRRFYVENGVVNISDAPLHKGLNLVKINVDGVLTVLKAIY